MERDFNYTIVERLGVLSTSAGGDFTTEVNRISYRGAAPKIDIRKWDKRDGEKMLKGVTLTSEEWEALKALALKGIQNAAKMATE